MASADLLDLVLPSRRATWPETAAIAVIGLLVIGFARPDLLTLAPPEFVHDHALLSMDLAISRAYCDAPSKVSNRFRLPYQARDRAELRSLPIPQVLVGQSGSMEKYCLTIGSPIINNENSLMWFESMLLRIAPSLSLERLSHWVHRLHLAGVVLAGIVALRLGAGVLISASLTFIALVVLGRLDEFGITVYPFDYVLLVVTAAMSALIASRTTSRRNRHAMILAIGLGAFSAFGGNLRTSHWPIYAMLPLGALLWSERSPGQRGTSRWLRAAGLTAGFVAGSAAFQELAIDRHLPEGLPETAHHTTWHSVVIGLAIPPNELSRREHLEWSDASAWRLAQSIDPTVAYISKDYERVLRGYYLGLWSRDAAAMRGLYLNKLHTAGVQMIEVLRGSPDRDIRWIWWLLRPAHLLPSGVFVLAGYTALMVVGVALIRFGHPGGWLVLMLSSIAAMVHVESVVITTAYLPQYHAYLAFAMLTASAAAPLIGVAVLRHALRPAMPQR